MNDEVSADIDAFKIYAGNGFISIQLSQVYGYPDSTCHFGGYDSQSSLEIKASEFGVKSLLYISTGDIHSFHEQLKKCHGEVNGSAFLESYEGNLKFELKFNDTGQAIIKGEFRDYLSDNSLNFYLISEQSYLNQTLVELGSIEKKYGGFKGVNN